jgi:hypothetical protein
VLNLTEFSLFNVDPKRHNCPSAICASAANAISRDSRERYIQYRVLLTYLHIPWSRVLLEKLSGLQLVKKFPAFYGARRVITAFTSARNLSLS